MLPLPRRLRFLTAALLALAATETQADGGRRKVIIDQDAFGPGGSNLQAILLVVQSPEVEVLGITIESGDGWCAENVAHTLRLLEIIGRTDIPVFAGATFPLVNSQEETRRWENRFGKLAYKGAFTENWGAGPNVKRPAAHGPEVVPPLLEGAPHVQAAMEPAAIFLSRKVREFPGEVSIVALGPLTNIALAIRLDEKFSVEVKELVFMGGSFSPRAADNAFALEYIYTPRLEFNFRWDPEAARIVLHAPWKKITQVPVDPTTETMFTPELARRATAANTPLAAYVAQYADAFPLWDELAAAVWLRPDLIKRQQSLAVDVDIDHGAGYGNTLSFAAGQGPKAGEQDVQVVFAVDVPRFYEFVVERFRRATPTRDND